MRVGTLANPYFLIPTNFFFKKKLRVDTGHTLDPPVHTHNVNGDKRKNQLCTILKYQEPILFVLNIKDQTHNLCKR
jgi:hypothetical protein